MKRIFNRSLLIGFLLGIGVSFVVAYFFGPRESYTQVDPITSRMRTYKTWLTIKTSEQITEDEVSNWVDRNMPVNMYFGQYGWQTVSQSHTPWFGGTSIGCGGSPAIPTLIYKGTISAEAKTREQLLAEYLAEIPPSFQQNANLLQLNKKWTTRVATAK